MFSFLSKSFIFSILFSFMTLFNFAFAASQSPNSQIINLVNTLSNQSLYLVGVNANIAVWNPTLLKLSDYGYLGGWALKMVAFDNAGTLWSVGFNGDVGKWNGKSWDGQGYMGGVDAKIHSV